MVKNLPAKAGDIETRVLFLGREDPLEEGMATHSCLENPRAQRSLVGAGGESAVHVVARSQTQLSD